MSNLCREAALGPIRSLSGADIQSISTDQVRSLISPYIFKAMAKFFPFCAADV